METSIHAPGAAAQEGWKIALRLFGSALRFVAGNVHLFLVVLDLCFGGSALLLFMAGSFEAGAPMPVQAVFGLLLLAFATLWDRFGGQGIVFVWSVFAVVLSLWDARHGDVPFRWKRRLAVTGGLWALAAIGMPFATLPENRPGMWGVIAVFAVIHLVVGLGAAGTAYALGFLATSILGAKPRFRVVPDPKAASKNAPT